MVDKLPFLTIILYLERHSQPNLEFATQSLEVPKYYDWFKLSVSF